MSRILPILFNTEMVQAILDGRKTVTRRLVGDRVCILEPENQIRQQNGRFEVYYGNMPLNVYENPTYHVGDIMYVRETWMIQEFYEDEALIRFRAGGEKPLEYENGGEMYEKLVKFASDNWNPSLFMPKEAARLFLRVTNVRVERLQEIKREDCEKEGLEDFCKKCSSLFSNCDTCLNDGGIEEEFKELWNSTIKKSDLDRYGWNANPWVWVIEFERCEKLKVAPVQS